MNDIIDTPTNQFADPTPTVEPPTKLEILKCLIAQIAELFPGQHLSLSVTPNYNSVTFHFVRTYQEGTELMRSLGIGERRKQIVDDADPPFCNLEADVDGLHINVFCRTMPPTCRLEKVIERVPKSQTVETGEFIEIERVKVVCGKEQP